MSRWRGSVTWTTVGWTNQPVDGSQRPPASTDASAEPFASSTYEETFRNAFSSMRAPIETSKSSTGSPTRNAATIGRSRSFTAGHSDAGTYARDAAEHFCPPYSKAPLQSAVASASTSADGWAKTKSFPPVSPTSRGQARYRPRCSATVDQIERNAAVEPVKWTPARSGLASATSATAFPSPGSRFTTPGGSPAASRSFSSQWAENIALGAGFQSTTLPRSAGAVGRFAAIAVKLNGVTARTNPSRGRYSTRFHRPGGESG